MSLGPSRLVCSITLLRGSIRAQTRQSTNSLRQVAVEYADRDRLVATGHRAQVHRRGNFDEVNAPCTKQRQQLITRILRCVRGDDRERQLARTSRLANALNADHYTLRVLTGVESAQGLALPDAYTTDFRTVYATVLTRILAADPAAILGSTGFAPIGFL